MDLFVLDTDTLSLYQWGHPTVCANVDNQPDDKIAIAVITVQEQLDGWHSRIPQARQPAQIAMVYQRLAETVRFLREMNILEFPVSAIQQYQQLLKLKLNIGRMDLRIAATVLDIGATLVTRNSSDFRRVPGLKIVDWSV